ncbi:hypothetical protein Droror1_Dr00019536 [Drosera rotundifolia]
MREMRAARGRCGFFGAGDDEGGDVGAVAMSGEILSRHEKGRPGERGWGGRGNIQFTNVTNAFVRNITSVDSKMFHINLLNCENMTFDQILINSPLTILNTDGIHVAHSKGINITNADIKMGTNCVSIHVDSQQINAEKVICGLGKGINVGGLGI